MKRQHGNALFLILIAVALFAALSYAVTNSGRGGSGIDKEQASLYAAQIVQYASLMEQTIARMQLINGCGDDEIAFWHDSNGDGSFTSADDYYNNGSADECFLYKPEGGGLTFQAPDAAWLDGVSTSETFYGEYLFNGSVCIDGFGCHTDGTADNSELMLFLPFIKKDICVELARNTNGLASGEPVVEGDDAWVNNTFKGNYHDGRQLDSSFGVRTGCFEGDNTPPSDTYVYFHVLINRE